MAKKKPLLSLSTSHEYAFIEIDGKKYEIKSLSQFDLVDLYTFDSLAEKFKGFGTEKLEPNQIEEFAKTLDDALKMLFVEIPVEVLNKLSIIHKMQIVKVFRELPLPTKEVAELQETGLQ